jgi:hypothetical protein
MAVEQFGKTRFWRGVLDEQERKLAADNNPNNGNFTMQLGEYKLDGKKTFRVELLQADGATHYNMVFSLVRREDKQYGYGIGMPMQRFLASAFHKTKLSESMALSFHLGYHDVPPEVLDANRNAYVL